MFRIFVINKIIYPAGLMRSFLGMIAGSSRDFFYKVLHKNSALPVSSSVSSFPDLIGESISTESPGQACLPAGRPEDDRYDFMDELFSREFLF